jgi:hypothetical protein
LQAAAHFGICVGSAKNLVLKGILPATQAIEGVQRVIERRRKHCTDYQYDRMIRLPGI